MSFSPGMPTNTISLTNVGTGTLVWSASSSAAWLSVGPAGGSLAAGQSANVVVAVDWTSLKAGAYSATVTLTSNGGSVAVRVTVYN
jgi:hypothetical protein